MGPCISIHRKASPMVVHGSSDSTNKSDHKPVMHSTQSKRKLLVMDGHVAVKPQLLPSLSMSGFSDYGSKEEIFFDSRSWLDSDYEDEFMSVYGEFTPSRGNTPVHHSSTPSRGNKLFLNPTEKRKRLLELFKESIRDNHGSSSDQFVEPSNKYGDKMNSMKNGLNGKRKRHTGYLRGCFTGLFCIRSKLRQKKNQT